MTTFVLVHGAWGGSWGWKDFAPLLRAQGHDVYTPSLTGLGERVHLGTPETNLDTHITDITNVIFYEDLHDIVLVGHSYGGMPVTGAADRMPDRIAHLVYLDAFLPRDGESCWDLGGAGQQTLDADGWRTHSPRFAASADAPPPTPEMQARAARMTTQPRGTLEQPVHLDVPLEQRAFTRTYIRATGDPSQPSQPGMSIFDTFVDLVRDDPKWRYLAIACGHGVQREKPQELAQMLLEIAGVPTKAAV